MSARTILAIDPCAITWTKPPALCLYERDLLLEFYAPKDKTDAIRIFQGLERYAPVVVIEAGYGGPNRKVVSDMDQQRGFFDCLATTLAMPVHFAPIGTWRKHVLPPGKKTTAQWKAAAVAHCLAKTGRTVSDDYADAFCIAEWAADMLSTGTEF